MACVYQILCILGIASVWKVGADENFAEKIAKALDGKNVREAVDIMTGVETYPLRFVTRDVYRKDRLQLLIECGDKLSSNNSQKSLAVLEETFLKMATSEDGELRSNELLYLYYAADRGFRIAAENNDIDDSLQLSFQIMKIQLEPHKTWVITFNRIFSHVPKFSKVLDSIARSSKAVVLNMYLDELTVELMVHQKLNLIPYLYFMENRCFLADLILKKYLKGNESSEDAFALCLLMKVHTDRLGNMKDFNSKDKCFSTYATLAGPTMARMHEFFEAVDSNKTEVLERLRKKYPGTMKLYEDRASLPLFIA